MDEDERYTLLLWKHSLCLAFFVVLSFLLIQLKHSLVSIRFYSGEFFLNLGFKFVVGLNVLLFMLQVLQST